MLALIICTYHRREQLLTNLEKIREGLFFKEESSLYGKLHIYVVDNAKELRLSSDEFFTYIPNENTGGSGGFRRGMEEVRKDHPIKNYTNVILMDDDVDFINESFYRLYSILSLMKVEHQNDVIAGRMFRTDDRNVQYTAAEIWNGGDLRHVGLNRDMSLKENLKDLNMPICSQTGEKAEYGGWWMACFPIGFILENDPLPFFLHCDDVEYGLRHGGTPIIWNGVQVWHETFEYRQSLMIEYYDRRNSLILNKKLGILKEWKDYIPEWKKIISEAHAAGDYAREYVNIKAFHDAMRNGEKEFSAPGVIEMKNNQKLHRFSSYSNIVFINKFYWRYIFFRAQM